jgi:beta-glucanase (GH16 family)
VPILAFDLGNTFLIDLTGYKLTFDDEFNTRSISWSGDQTKWQDARDEWRMADGKGEVGFGRSSFVDPSSGYDPFSVKDGALTITAVPDKTSAGVPGSWESGLITTQGNFSQKYGYFEMRADLSDKPGGWDGFWLLPDQQAAATGKEGGWQELDTVEHYGVNNKGVYSTIHTTDPSNGVPWQVNRQVYSEHDTTGYHTYGVNWGLQKLDFYYDGQLMGSQATPSDYKNPMYLIANLATQDGADGGGDQTMKIDYIRAYSKDPSATAVAQGQVSAPDGKDPGMYGAMAAASGTPSAAQPATSSSTGTTNSITGSATAPTGSTSAAHATTSIGSGSDKLVLKISQDAYQGDAQYTVSVDGKQVGGTLTAHAAHGTAGYLVAGSSAQDDQLTVLGNFGAGAHTVSVNFLNDAYGNPVTATTDRNLYVDAASYNGATITGGSLTLLSNGAQSFSIPATSAAAGSVGTSSNNTGTGGISSTASPAAPAAPGVRLTHDTGTGNMHVTSDGLITFTPSVNGDTLHYQLDNGNFSTTAPVLTLDGSADGQHTVTVYETGASGLSSAYTSLAFSLDTHHALGSSHPL